MRKTQCGELRALEAAMLCAGDRPGSASLASRTYAAHLRRAAL